MNKRVIKNAYWIIVCKVIQSIVTLIIGMLTARYLGPANYGILNYAVSIVAFMLPIMQLGLNQTLVKELIDNPENENEIIGTSILINIFMSLFCIISCNIFVLIFN